MATPGSATQKNRMAGLVGIMNVSTNDVTGEHKTVVTPKGVLIRLDNGKVFVGDGVTTFEALASGSPLIDQVLNLAEKTALSKAFTSGSYAAAADGVVVHGSDGKIDDASLKVVVEGHIADSYLSKFFDGSKIKVDALPDTARGGMTYIANYAALSGMTEEQKKGMVFVIDATDDPDGNVKSGAAIYAWVSDAWLKIAEHESLDINIEALTPNYTNVQAAGAVMYDHTLVITAPSLAEFAALTDAEAD